MIQALPVAPAAVGSAYFSLFLSLGSAVGKKVVTLHYRSQRAEYDGLQTDYPIYISTQSSELLLHGELEEHPVISLDV